jgi:hypothetical protein
MSTSVPCEFCGKIIFYDNHRRDIKCCDNLCSSKLNYYQKHNFLSPYQKHIGAELNYAQGGDLIMQPPPDQRIEEHKPVIKKKSDDTSFRILQEAENKLKEYKPYKN